MEKCVLCPRKCLAERNSGKIGYCGAGDKIKIAKAMLHMWEEPPISGENGSGAVFFSNCTLRCEFCQNFKISAEGFGKEITEKRLAEIFLELQEKGAHNINLVSPTPYVDEIKRAIDSIRGDLKIPVVYNTSGYETAQTIKGLDGYVDIFLPDLKYVDSCASKELSHAENYFEFAGKAIIQMQKQTGANTYDKNGMLKKGIIVRHMVLPGYVENSLAVLKWVSENLPLDDILVSIMSQYTPFHNAHNFPKINRRLSEEEYERVLDFADELGIENGFIQELSSAKEEYTPEFDLQGV